MLKLMRKNAGSWMVKFILGAIIIVFTFWGVGTWQAERRNQVASVNGASITYDEYRQVYDSLVDQARQQFGGNLSDNVLKMLQLDQRALDRLIQQELLKQEAKRLGLRVTDLELERSIAQYPAFQEGGSFNRQLYRAVLEQNHLTPEAFENDQRVELLIEKLRRSVVGVPKVSEAEIEDWYQWQNATVDLDVATFSPDRYTDMPIKEADVRAFFNENRANYQSKPEVKVKYMIFPFADFRSKAVVSEKDISAYYDAHIADYSTPKMVEARHILIKVAPDADAAAVAKALARAKAVEAKARAGEDFAMLAKTYSEGPTKDRGGYLGFFKKEDMVKPFADKAFSMHEGEISDPVRTRFGWHIIKVEKIRPASTKTLESVSAEIRQTLLDEQAKKLADAAVKEAYDKAFESTDLADVAKSLGVNIKTTDFFDKDGPVGVPDGSAFASAAFKLGINDVSDIIEGKNAYYLLQVIGKKAARPLTFEEAKAEARADLVIKRQKAEAKADAEAFLNALKKGATIDESKNKYNIQPISTGPFKRETAIPHIGYDAAISQAAFHLSPAHPLPNEVFQSSGGFVVIRLKSRKEADMAGLEKVRDEIRQRLQAEKERQVFQALIDRLKSTGKIEVSENFKSSFRF